MFSRVIDPAEYENGHENDLWYLEFCESLPLNTLLDESDCHWLALIRCVILNSVRGPTGLEIRESKNFPYSNENRKSEVLLDFNHFLQKL